MSHLVEHILSENYVSAADLFEERLNNIVEKKLIEKKKMMQAEVMGGMSKQDIEKRRKAGYVRASEVLPDPRDYDMDLKIDGKPKIKKPALKRKKKVSEETLDEAGLAPTKVGKVYRAGLKAGGGIGSRLGLAKHTIQTYMQQRKQKKADVSDDDFAQQASKAAGAEPSHVETPKVNRPGRLQRNINTLMGRKPNEGPEKTPPEERGGRAGKAVRQYGSFMKSFAGRIASGLGEDIE
jgi:hypothetical protein